MNVPARVVVIGVEDVVGNVVWIVVRNAVVAVVGCAIDPHSWSSSSEPSLQSV